MTSIMEPSTQFFRIRAITFTCVMMFSFLWLVLLCVEMFTRWSISDAISQSLMVMFILTNTTTLIMLPILILVPFRMWLDKARLLLLFVLQVGSAVAGSVWGPKIQCPDQTPDDLGICQLISVYTMIACWIIPTILGFYSTYFAVVVYFQSRIPVAVEPMLYKRRSDVDLECGSTGSLPSWNEKIKKFFIARGSNTDTGVSPRPLEAPTLAHARQSSLLQHQSTMTSSLHTSQRPHRPLPPVPSRHYSLPPFKHGTHGPHLRPLLTLSMSRSPTTNASSSHPQTPSYPYLYSPLANPRNPYFSLDIADVPPPNDHRGISGRLSMMHLSSSPGETQGAEGSFTTRPTRAKLLKPLPAHLM